MSYYVFSFELHSYIEAYSLTADVGALRRRVVSFIYIFVMFHTYYII